MYVKVTAGTHGGDFLAKVHPPLHSDFIAVPLGKNAVWDENHNLVSPGDIDFGEALNIYMEYGHVLEISADQTQYEANKNMIAVRYAWWNDPDTGLTAVITTRNIFILGENGKTIDRV